MAGAVIVDPDVKADNSQVVDLELTAEQIAEGQSAAAKAFSESVGEEPVSTSTETPIEGTGDTTTNTGEQPEGVKVDEKSPTETTKEEPPQPKVVQVTEEQWNGVIQQLNDFKQHSKALKDEMSGKLGGLQQLVQQIRTSSSAGKKKATLEHFAKLKGEFPLVAQMLVEGLNEAGLELGGGEAAQVDLTPIKTELEEERKQRERLQSELEAERQERQAEAMEALAEKHADWKDVVGVKGANGEVPKTEFRAWAATLPEEEQQRLWNSWSPRYLAKVLSDFKDHQKKEKAQIKRETAMVDGRRAKLAGSVPPRSAGGGGGGPKALTTEREGFLAALEG